MSEETPTTAKESIDDFMSGIGKIDFDAIQDQTRKKARRPGGYQRACHVWSLLAYAASKSQILTCEEIVQYTGIPATGLRDYLSLIDKYCEERECPNLRVIVVNEETGLLGEVDPKKAVEQSEGIANMQIKVKRYGEQWLKVPCPEPDDFKRLDDADKDDN